MIARGVDDIMISFQLMFVCLAVQHENLFGFAMTSNLLSIAFGLSHEYRVLVPSSFLILSARAAPL